VPQFEIYAMVGQSAQGHPIDTTEVETSQWLLIEMACPINTGRPLSN
jgi:hypothetical protein